MVNSGVQRLKDQLQFLKQVPLLSKLPDDILAKLSDAFELVHFTKGDYIVRQVCVLHFEIISRQNRIVLLSAGNPW